MKAIVYTSYGPPNVLRLEEVETPTPSDDQVLVKVHAASVNRCDCGFVRGRPLAVRLWSGLLRPRIKILGVDIAGRVEAAGRNANQFQPGDDVFGEISVSGWGGFAEYACASENALVSKPVNLTFAEAAAVPLAAVTALQGLRDHGRIRAGQKVLINGASGGVGMFAVQIAKSFGAEVTGVCSTRNLEMARSIGADQVIDYTEDDFTRNEKRYDLIFAVNGYHPISDYRRALNSDGTYVCAGGSMAQVCQAMFLGPFASMGGSKRMVAMGPTKQSTSDLEFVKELLEAGKVMPVIDKCYPLSEVPEAIRHLEEVHARGKVVILFGAYII
jgi:NADPH:quinone reductase-like Zn-dependent oxidoreductase